MMLKSKIISYVAPDSYENYSKVAPNTKKNYKYKH